MNHTKDQIIEAANIVQSLGDVEINIYADGRYRTLSPTQLGEYAENPDMFLAEMNGVSPEHYKRWKSLSGLCGAITVAGNQCQHWVNGNQNDDPAKFKPGETDICKFHKWSGFEKTIWD